MTQEKQLDLKTLYQDIVAAEDKALQDIRNYVLSRRSKYPHTDLPMEAFMAPWPEILLDDRLTNCEIHKHSTIIVSKEGANVTEPTCSKVVLTFCAGVLELLPAPIDRQANEFFEKYKRQYSNMSTSLAKKRELELSIRRNSDALDEALLAAKEAGYDFSERHFMPYLNGEVLDVLEMYNSTLVTETKKGVVGISIVFFETDDIGQKDSSIVLKLVG